MDWATNLMTGLALTLVATGDRKPVTYHETVGNSEFRVTVKDGKVTVARKAFMFPRTVDLLIDMKKAVRQATGCYTADEIWVEAKLKARLVCSN